MQLHELGLTRPTRGVFPVPVIAVFTKYDQFKRDIKLEYEDDHPETDIDAEVKRVFEQHYLAKLSGPPPFIHLESEKLLMTNLYNAHSSATGMHMHGQRCTDLIKLTASSLSSLVALMLVAVQKDNLEVSIDFAIEQWVCIDN